MSLELAGGLFSNGDRVICAVSGGADSMALLWSLFCGYRELTVEAAHFNHRLRGAQSDRDEAFVRAFCAQHGIPLHLGGGDVKAYAEQNKKTLEEAARILRYEFLLSLDCDKLATAHTADDNAETVVMHLFRGSGLKGLCGIAPVRGRIVRPMLRITRQEVETFLRSEGISWVDDSTNADTAFTRNRVRHEILPLLKKENPNFLQSVSAHCEIFREENEILDSLANDLLLEARDGKTYDCQTLAAAPDALQKRALRILLRELLPQDVSLRHIEAVQTLLKNPAASASTSLPRGLTAQMFYGRLRIAKSPNFFQKTTLAIPGTTLLPEVGWKISCVLTKNLQNFANSPFHFALKYDMIAEHGLSVRARQVGDMLTLSCRKSLKKWFIERRIPVFDREKLPVFISGDRLAAVAGLGADRAFCPTVGEQVLVVQIDPAE